MVERTGKGAVMVRTVRLRALLAVALVIAIPGVSSAQDEGPSPVGTEWYLTAYDAGERELTPVPWDLVATLDLGDFALGSDGCNPFNASYSLDGEALTIGDPGHGDKACDEQTTAVEAAYLAALPKVARWTIDTGATSDQSLILFDADDRQLLQFSSSDIDGLFRQVRELTAQLQAQRQVIKNLRARIRELEQGG
jgi:hypothetical protein